MNQERIYHVLMGPHISEKSSGVGDDARQVVFRVAKNATKREVKTAVEKLFNVKVEEVNTINVKGKVKRNKFGYSKKNDWKKAYVRLQDGQNLDLELAE